MKKIYFTLLLIPLLCLNGFSQISYSVSFNQNFLTITDVTIDSTTYCSFNFTEAKNYIGDTGMPMIPFITKNFIIPTNMDVDDINITSSSFQKISLMHKVIPKQKDIPTSSHYFSVENIVDPDSNIYNTNIPYPYNSIYHIGTGFFDGVNKIITVSIYPIQYLPLSDTVLFYTNINFTINLKIDSSYNNNFSIYRGCNDTAIYNNILRSLIDNPQDMFTLSNLSLNKTTPSKAHNLPYYEYVIITDNTLITAFTDFINWKKRKGIDIGVVTTTDIYNEYSTNTMDTYPIIDGGNLDNAARIREYLKDAYSNGGTIWALLGGTPTFVPMRVGNGTDNSTSYYYNIPTDLYFADFNGDWNTDNDGFYGEITEDHPDYLPEIFVGRLLCSTSQDILNWTQHVLKYEQNPGNGNYNYLLESLMVQADEMQDNNEANLVSTHLPIFNSTIMQEHPSFDAQYDLNGNIQNYFPDPSLNGQPGHYKGAEIVAEMNNHYGLHGWFCHGGTGIAYNGVGESGIAVMSNGINGYACKLQAEDNHDHPDNIIENINGLDNLDCTDYPSILYSISCDVVPYEMTSSSGLNSARNCGEAFTNILSTGGVAFLGNTRYGWVMHSTYIFNIFSDMISSTNNDYLHLGTSEALSKSTYNGYNRHYLRYSHNLIGCPETQIWTEIPIKFEVDYNPNYVFVNLSNDISIFIDNLTYNTQATICLYKNGEIFEKQVVIGDMNNHAEFLFTGISASSIGDILLTVTAPNYIPFQGSIPVISECDYSDTPLNINSDFTLDGGEVYNNDIIVSDHAIFTIKGRAMMHENAKITIEQGAQLVIDGGKITKSCGDYWQGIEVWGNSTQHQYTVGGTCAQGIVELKNGAVVENAVCGIKTMNTDAATPSATTGGIIIAENSTFRNCRKAIEFMPYHNFHPTSNITLRNLSSIRQCTFETDKSVNPDIEPIAFIRLSGVVGVIPLAII